MLRFWPAANRTEDSTELKNTVAGTKAFWGRERVSRTGKCKKTIGNFVWGLLSLRCLVHICSGYSLLFCNKQLQTYWHKTTTSLLSSGMLWTRNLDRAHPGWLISIPLCLGPQLRKFQWLGAEIIWSIPSGLWASIRNRGRTLKGSAYSLVQLSLACSPFPLCPWASHFTWISEISKWNGLDWMVLMSPCICNLLWFHDFYESTSKIPSSVFKVWLQSGTVLHVACEIFPIIL